MSAPAAGVAPEINHHRGGAGEPLVLIHGIGHHWQGWSPVIPELAREFDVLACDSPGFGRSPVLPPGTLVLPVGGVDAAAMPAWRDAGAAGFGIGSAIYRPGDTAAAVAAKARALLG